jgi:hypothetical protein
MASGHVNRIKRPNTWLHRTSPHVRNVPCVGRLRVGKSFFHVLQHWSVQLTPVDPSNFAT